MQSVEVVAAPLQEVDHTFTPGVGKVSSGFVTSGSIYPSHASLYPKYILTSMLQVFFFPDCGMVFKSLKNLKSLLEFPFEWYWS